MNLPTTPGEISLASRKETTASASPNGSENSVPSGVSPRSGSLAASEEGSLRMLASALVELAIQILRDEKESTEEEEAA